MALSLLISGLPSVQAVREAMGRPTADPADPGYVPDALVERIVQRYHDDLVLLADRKLGELALQGGPCAAPEDHEVVEVALAVSPSLSPLYEGVIPAGYYPCPLRASDDAGRTLRRDPHARRTVAAAFAAVAVYDVVGSKVYTNPPFPGNDAAMEACYLLLPPLQAARDFVLGGEAVLKANEAIVREARATFEAVLKEGTRLAQVLRTDDGVPGDHT